MKEKEYKNLIKELDLFIEENEDSIFKDLAAIISIPSTKGEQIGEKVFGEECARMLEKILTLGDEYGFYTQNHDYYCGSIMYGEGERDEIGIVTHLDIVPAGDGWTSEPFILTEKEGLYIGRGTLDDKGPTIAALYAMRFLKEKKISLPYNLRLIMGCDEESGMTDLPYYLQTMKPPMFSFTPDADYPVCVGEKGITEVEIELGELSDKFKNFVGGTVSNAVADSASIFIDDYNNSITNSNKKISIEKSQNGILVNLTGIAGHAAYPEGTLNAIALISDWLIEQKIVSENSEDYKIFNFLRKALSDYHGEYFGIKMSDDESGKLTCIGGIIRTDDKKVVLNINIRYPVTKSIGEVFGKLSETLGRFGFNAKLLYDKPPYYITPDNPQVLALMDAYSTVTGRIDKPYTTGGGTYARAFPDCVAFGISYPNAKKLLGEGKGGPHERDEYIPKEDLFEAIKIFVIALINLG